VAAINTRSGTGTFATLAADTTRMLAAMDVLFDTGLLNQSSCVWDAGDGTPLSYNTKCSYVWDTLLDQAGDVLAPVLADPSLFDDTALYAILNVLQQGMVAFQPMATQRPMGQDYVLANPYKPPVERTRGGVTSLYSQTFHLSEGNDGGKFDTTTLDPLFEQAGLPTPYASPFTSILAVGDGACMSTCTTWGATAWLHSTTTPGAPAFEWLTYGGTGHKNNIQPMTALAGFAANSDSGRPETPKLWAYWAFIGLAGSWLDDAELTAESDDLVNIIAEFPALGNDLTTPDYPQGEICMAALGGAAGSAPAEYLQWPTDHYLPKWYVNAMDVGGADVWPLYADAEAFLPAA
jgi:hypothetical protein